MKTYLFLLLVLLSPLAIRAGSLVFNPDMRAAYQAVLSLRFDEARQLLAAEQANNPNNLLPLFIENYLDFFTVLIREDKAEFDRLERNKNRRLEAIEAQGDENSPYFLYTQAEIILQWALARVKFEEYYQAFNEVRRAYSLLESNMRKFPDFVANKKSMGVLHAIIGSVPAQYKWGVNLVGMNGSVQQGLAEIKQVIDYGNNKPDFIFRDEAIVLYAFLLLNFSTGDSPSWSVISTAQLDPKTNPLACFVKASIAVNMGMNDQAIQLLSNRPKGSNYAAFPYLDFMLGLAKLNRLDADADVYLQKYISQHPGRHYIKEAYQKLAWHSMVLGKESKYPYYMNLVLTRGYAQTDGDKNAEREAKKETRPHVLLLKARLLFDGGYYQKALDILAPINPIYSFQNQAQLLEYTYRRGRILHKLNRTSEAIAEYQKTIDGCRNCTYYFACNAALQLGTIYEEQRNRTQAAEYYSRCLSMKPDEYAESLHQKAKAGLARVK